MNLDNELSSILTQCGLNADWSCCTWYLGQGTPNRTSGDFYLCDNEDDTYTLVQRFYDDKEDDRVVDHHTFREHEIVELVTTYGKRHELKAAILKHQKPATTTMTTPSILTELHYKQTWTKPDLRGEEYGIFIVEDLGGEIAVTHSTAGYTIHFKRIQDFIAWSKSAT